MEKKHERTLYPGFVVSDSANLIDLSTVPLASNSLIPSVVSGQNVSVPVVDSGSVDIPLVVGEYDTHTTGTLPLDSSDASSFIPSVVPGINSSSSPLEAFSGSTICSSNCSTVQGTEELVARERLERIEQDIEDSADLLADLGF